MGCRIAGPPGRSEHKNTRESANVSAFSTWSLALAILLFEVVPGFAASPASAMEVSSIVERRVIEEGVEWCTVPAGVTRDKVGSGACELKPLVSRKSARNHIGGLNRDSAWLRIRLRNDSKQEIERWLWTGASRVNDIAVFQEAGDKSWSVNRLGLAVPMAERSGVGRFYGVTPIFIAPRSEREIWVRIVSKQRVELVAVIWEPDAFRVFQERFDFWLSLMFGGILAGVVGSLMMCIITRRGEYGFFLAAIVGETIVDTLRTGFMRRFLWPVTEPLPIELLNFGGLLSVVGFSACFFKVVPERRDLAWLYASIRVLLAIISIFYIYGLLFDFYVGAQIAQVSTIPLTFLMTVATYLRNRSGDDSANWILLSFSMLCLLGLLRSPLIIETIGSWWTDAVISPTVTLLVTMTILVGLLARSRKLELDLVGLRAATNSQVSFLARMSHELRTPLDTVLGNAQLIMRSERREQMNAEIASILQSGRHLLSMIDEILDYSRGIAGALRLRPGPVLLSEYLQSLKTSCQVMAGRNRNRFVMRDASDAEVPKNLVLQIDAGRLRQVLDNLISNAARHTHDGTITLEVCAKAVSDRRFWVGFAVSDTGEGIAAEDQARVFQPFERVGRTAYYGGKGAGVGLAIAQQIVSLMGGDLELRSALGQGSTFSFSLVVDRALAEEAARVSVVSDQTFERYSGAKRLVLVIDDDPGSRAIFVALLENAGFLVREADSGNAALELVDELPQLDVVLTDQFMPDGDGWVVLDGVSARRPDVPCVMISAAPPNPPEGRTSGRHFAATFLKPVDHATLLRVIGEFLQLDWIKPGVPGPAARDFPRPRVELACSELAEFRQLVAYSDVTGIRDWARRLRQVSPENSEFADRVEVASLDLDLASLETLCKGGHSEGANS